MRLSEAEYRSLVEHSPVLIWRAGLDAKCDYFNETWLQFTGRTLAQESGDGWAEGVHPEDLDRCVRYYLDHFGRREAFEMEYRLRRHDGVYRWILDRGAPFEGADGKFAGFIGSCIDVDERRRAQEEKIAKGERALEVADEFEKWILGIVGHDIRNPLGAISNAAHLASAKATDPEVVRRNTERISRSVKRIGKLVEDLLDITRERRGGIPIDPRLSDFAAICRTVADELTVGDAQQRVVLSGPPELTGIADPDRIAQAVSNLLANAVQHGVADAPIELQVAEAPGEVEIKVRNEGVIPPERLASLFKPFTGAQVSRSPSGGLGLGLFISSAIAKAHGGRLEVESSAETGTTFRLRLPRGLTASA